MLSKEEIEILPYKWCEENNIAIELFNDLQIDVIRKGLIKEKLVKNKFGNYSRQYSTVLFRWRK